jgi:hypothetical protein
MIVSHRAGAAHQFEDARRQSGGDLLEIAGALLDGEL